MPRILQFILISSICFFNFGSVRGQNSRNLDTSVEIPRSNSNTKSKGPPDSLVQVHHEISVGLDLASLLMPIFQPNRNDFEFSVDMAIKNNLFGVVEAGSNSVSINRNPTFSYKSRGTFYRIGFNFNLLKPTYPGEQNIIYGGIRLGHAQVSEESPYYTIKDSFWGNAMGSIPKFSLGVNWIEFLTGIKIQLDRHFSMGWSLRARILLTKQTNPLPTYIIPGYGKGLSQENFDFNYSVYYNIPVFTNSQIVRKKLKK